MKGFNSTLNSGEDSDLTHRLINSNYIVKIDPQLSVIHLGYPSEVIPFIKHSTSNETEIITCGASFGALHSMNLFLKRPDLINGVIAMSGVYDLTEYTDGHFDDQVYFNSPMHYIQNLEDHYILEQIRKSRHLHIFTGSGAYEDPNASKSFAGLLYSKGINYELDVWGEEWKHDWPTWRALLPHYFETRF